MASMKSRSRCVFAPAAFAGLNGSEAERQVGRGRRVVRIVEQL
jgi:hypothetical protein